MAKSHYKKFTAKRGQPRYESKPEAKPEEDVFDRISEKQDQKGLNDWFEPTRNY